MDPAGTVLGKMLTQEITPVVMVLRTPLVEDACRKNGISFIDMLSPFSRFDNIDVPVRTASDQAYRLQKFKLRLFYASDIHKTYPEAARERLHKVITEAAGQDTTDLCAGVPKIEDKLATSKGEVLPPWFEGVNKELVHNSSFSDHEAFDHPVACLLVVSSKDEAPINKFVDLFNTNQLPSILNDGVMDPKVLKQYLLLHDNQEGSPEEASKFLSEMKSTFGSNDCQLLCINTSLDGLDEKDNPWASYKSVPSITHCAGCFLNTDDINEIKNLVQDLSTKHIIPHMEQKIRLLNQQVSATRKGFRNQIKNLWWRKGKEDTPDTSNGQLYTYSSIESQIRVLGDYAFMLQDYELALSNYRIISTDYKLDKAWKRYAGVQEMMGLAYFMLDQSRKEAEYCMETAFTTYLKLGKSQEYAIRCGLWWVEMLKAWDHYKEAASVYFRLSGEEPLLSALMLEQASYCYFFSTPPMLRKYGFHLVLSGDSYEKCDQVRHAIRVYRTALSVLKGTTWSLIRDHIRFQLGKWFASLGMFEVAIEHMLEILACTHQSKAAQELFLRDFIQLVQKTGKTFEVCRLELPIIKLPSLKVLYEDHRTFAAPSAVGVKESTWRSLEEDLIPSSSAVKANWLELHTKLVSNKYQKSNICAVGEAIKVEIGFKNPLQIPLSITSVSLICIHSESDDATEMDALGVAADVPHDEQVRRFIARNDSFAESSSVSTSKVDFSLRGGETLVVQLNVTPRIEGNLKIVGVRWKLSGSVVGFQSFELNDAKKKNVKGRRKPKKSPGSELKFVVIKSLPRLEGSIRHFPKRSYHGELHQLILELKNQSNLAVRNVKMKISHPRFLLVGNPEAINAEFPDCLTDGSPMNANILAKGKEMLSCFHFPKDLVIQGEEPFRCPMWLHAAESGTTSLHIVIYYEVDDTSSAMRYRTLRMTYNLEVLPALDVSFKISHHPSSLQEVLVRMDVVNKTSSENFQIHQLSAVGSQWELTMLQPFDTPWKHMTAGQVLSSFLKLKNVRKAVSSEDEVSNDDIDCSHVSLGSQAENKALFDISRSPVADFHHHERLLQEISDQGALDSVDFILIYQPHRSGDRQLLDQSRVFSHHACHCSLTSTGPIYWQMDGPQTIHHDFSTSLCEIPFKLTVHNSLNAAVSLHIRTVDPSISTNHSSESNSAASDNQIGWHDVSVVKELRVTTDVLGLQTVKKVQKESISPFMWSRSSSTRLELAPLSTTEVPIQICVFTPGIYDVSYYNLEWKTLPSSNQKQEKDAGASSGVCAGRSFYITVLQSP